MASSSESHGTHDLNGAQDTTSEPVCTCQACNRPYETDMLVPDDVWEAIKPEGGEIGAGLLCPTCIMDRAADRLGWSVGFVYPERHGDAVTAGKAAPSSEVVAAAHYRVGNPSAWSEGYDEAISEEIRALLALISSLVAERDTAETSHTAARQNFITMQQAAAVLLKRVEKATEHLGDIIRAYDANSGAKPSVSVLARAIDEARASIGGVNG